MSSGAPRDARGVFEDHLREATAGSIEADLRRNYAEDVVVLTGGGVHHGHEGLRELNRRLQRELPKAVYRYRTKRVEGDVAFLEWTASAADVRVDDGADTFVIRDGRIVAQTIHYTVVPEHA